MAKKQRRIKHKLEHGFLFFVGVKETKTALNA